jgi:sulfur-oxidizing protein SoxZ
MRTKESDGKIYLRALIEHPMETGLRKDKKTGVSIPAHFINSVVVEVNGEAVFSADWTTSVSKDPFLSISFDGGTGDKVRLTWNDNMGNSDSLEQTVK